MREKVGKSRFTVFSMFFQWFVARWGRKVGSLKRRVWSHLARGEMKSCTPLWREAHLEVKMYKTHHARTTFGSWDVEKVHAVVARSTFRSQNVQNTRGSDHFWKLRCRESARRCGAKHMSKSKCTKHTILGPLLEVEMSKKCTPLWREAHFQVKMYKTPHVRATFGGSDVEKVYAVVARRTFRSKHVQNTWGSPAAMPGRRPVNKDLGLTRPPTSYSLYCSWLAKHGTKERNRRLNKKVSVNTPKSRVLKWLLGQLIITQPVHSTHYTDQLSRATARPRPSNIFSIC